MKKILPFITVLFIIGCIAFLCESFYNATSYNYWTEQAIQEKLLRKENSFYLVNSATHLVARGVLVNCTTSNIEIKENEILIYCKDNSTDTIYTYKNEESYEISPGEEQNIYITVYRGVYCKENLDYVQQLLSNYQILKIEYQPTDGEVHDLHTIAGTGSYFVPLGAIIAAPILCILLILLIILCLPIKKKIGNENNQVEKQQINFNYLKNFIKSQSLTKKILILSISLLIYISPIIAGLIAVRDNQWNLTVFAIVTTIMGVGILTNLCAICFIAIKKLYNDKTQKLSKMIENALNLQIEKKKTEIQYIKDNLNEEKNKVNIEEQELAKEQYTSIVAFQVKIRQCEQKISEYKSSISLKERLIIDLQQQIERAKSENLEFEIKNLQRLDGWQFEKYCANLFRKLGYSVRTTKGSGDFGADLILNDSISVQCKLYSNPVGLHALQEVYSSMARYKTTKSCVITNSTFTKQAIEYAHDANIELIDYKALKSIIAKVLASNNEVDIESANKINELQSEIADMNNSIYSLVNEIPETINIIHELEICISKIPVIMELREKVRILNEQSTKKINNLLKEIQEIQFDLSVYDRTNRQAVNDIGKKYNLL